MFVKPRMHALVQLRDPGIFDPLVQALSDGSPTSANRRRLVSASSAIAARSGH